MAKLGLFKESIVLKELIIFMLSTCCYFCKNFTRLNCNALCWCVIGIVTTIVSVNRFLEWRQPYAVFPKRRFQFHWQTVQFAQWNTVSPFYSIIHSKLVMIFRTLSLSNGSLYLLSSLNLSKFLQHALYIVADHHCFGKCVSIAAIARRAETRRKIFSKQTHVSEERDTPWSPPIAKGPRRRSQFRPTRRAGRKKRTWRRGGWPPL